MNLFIECEKSDLDFIAKLRDSFDEIEIFEKRGFDGIEFLMIAIGIAQLTVETVSLIITIMSTGDSKNNRFIIVPNGKIDIKGYSATDLIKIIKELRTEDENR